VKLAWRRWVGLGGLVLVAALSAGFAFGISSNDRAQMRAFAEAVRRWQVGPDFRAVQREYVTLGVAAMQARLVGVSGQTYVMAFRSLPGLPAYISASESSAAHYRAFSESELAAYLHLSGEQGIAAGVEMIEKLAACQPLGDADIIEFLDGFKLPVSIPTDAGAVASVRRLIHDIEPARPLTIRANLVQLLRPHVDAIRVEHPPDAQAALDARVRATDYELWRTKQVNDFLAGIWAVGYGQIYLDAIEWLFVGQRVAVVVLVISALALLMMTNQCRMNAKTPSRQGQKRQESNG
jgi:hypothetical protein